MTTISHSLRAPAWLVVTAVAYFLTAWACHELPANSGVLTPIWLPSGVAVAALLLGGYQMAAGVFVADVAINLTYSFGLATSAGIAVGDTLEAVVAVALIQRFCPQGLRKADDPFQLVPIVAVACAVSATIGTTLLGAADELTRSWPHAWRLYWSSTATSIILVAPLALALRHGVDDAPGQFRRRRSMARVLVEVVALATLLAIVCTCVFIASVWDLLGLLLIFPLLTWATVRFGQVGASCALLMVAAFGIYGTTRETVDVAGMNMAQVTEVLQLLLALVLLANLVLAVALAERDRARAGVEELVSAFGSALQLARVGSWQLRLRPRGGEGGAGDPDPELDGHLPRATGNGDGADDTGPMIVPTATLAEVAAALGSEHLEEASVRVWCSRELSEVLGLNGGESHHRPLGELLALVAPEDRQRLVRAARRAIADGGTWRVEHAVRRASDGARRVIRHLGTVIDHDDPEGARLVGSVLDVTDQREVELLKDSLIATASHELRTPLTSVLGFASTLGRHWDNIPEGERLHYLHIIEDQSRRLLDIVNDTLQQAQLDRRTLPVSIAPVEVEALIVDALRELPDRGSVQLDSSCDEDVLADPRHVRRILTNLLTNAHKYGAPPVLVECARTTADGEDAIAIRVIDHGQGAPREFEHRMFDRFTRGPDTADAPGTGLGLSIVRGLARAMHGSVSYRRDGGRTVFELVLPAAGASVTASSAVADAHD